MNNGVLFSQTEHNSNDIMIKNSIIQYKLYMWSYLDQYHYLEHNIIIKLTDSLDIIKQLCSHFIVSNRMVL